MKMIVESQKVLTTCKEFSHNMISNCNKNERGHGLYNLNYHHNHIDIPPKVETSNMDSEHENLTYSKENRIPEEITKLEVTLENEIVIKEELSETEYLNKEHNIGDKKERKRRKELNCDELKFEMKYLNLEEQKKEIEDSKTSEKYKRMKYHCVYCGVGFLTDDVFDEHMLRHEKNAGAHECRTCHLRFKSQEVLSQHVLAHRRRFICTICKATFKRWSHCITHRYKCGGIPTPLACDDCRKIFSNYHSLDVHMKGVHKKDKKYVCERCDKRFNSKQRLTVHMRTHTGLKPFACEHCNKSFATNSNLRSHSTVHVEAKPHYCVECNTYYKSEKGLKRHFMESAKHLNTRK